MPQHAAHIPPTNQLVPTHAWVAFAHRADGHSPCLFCLPPPAGLAGRVKQTLFPPLPQRLLYGPRQDFTFPSTQFLTDVATGSDALVATTAGRGGRGRGRGRGR